ncbi:hypothetical protein Ancab_026413 [Ancistrocladus abbreviatus]
MAAACSLTAASSPAIVLDRRRDMRRKRSLDTVIKASSSRSPIPPSSVSTPGSRNEMFKNRGKDAGDDRVSESVKEYFETVAVMIGSEDGGPPRWFTPLECGGIDGTGLGLVRHHRRLGKMFDVWCLHIPVKDRTPFTGDSMRLFMGAFQKGLMLPEAVADLSEGLHSLAFYFLVIADILPRSTLMWKMEMLKSSSAYANSHLHAVKAQTLILSSGRDPLLPNHEEGERLHRLLPKCEIRKFDNKGHFLYLEDGVDLVYTIKGTTFYRRGRSQDYFADYLLPTPSDMKKAYEGEWAFINAVTCPVMLSTLANGKIVKGLAGVPSEGPVLLVGYHMLMGFEVSPLLGRIFTEKDILIMGAIPVSGLNMFKLFASKSHVLLYPGGSREALHRKGEEYKLFWPEQPEFIRMAARFGAKIVPFGAVGEDDIGQVVADYNDLMRIPYFRSRIEQLTKAVVKLRTESRGEVANQDLHEPVVMPKLPGRFYYLFGKPIETEGRREELKERDKAHALYLHVQSEVERCLAYLKYKRESDPYRNLVPRMLYQAANDFTSDVPTFEL